MRLLLVALLVLPGLVSAAAPPAPTRWSPAAVPSIVTSALSTDGGTIALALGPSTLTPGQTPATRDLAVLDFTTGIRWNNTCTGPCGGKLDVALNSNGDFLLSGGPAGSSALQLFRRTGAAHSTAEAAGGWVRASTTPVYKVAVSADAGAIAALTGAAGGNSSSLIQYDRTGQAKPSFPAAATPPQFAQHQGRFHAVAVSEDGHWVAVGGTRLIGSTEAGIVYLMQTGSTEVRGVAEFSTPVRNLAMSRDARVIVAALDDSAFGYMGRLDFGTLTLARPVAPGAVRDVATAGDGSLVAVAHANGVAVYRPSGDGNLTRAWSANLTGGAHDVALSADGRTVVAATAAGGVGFASHAPTVLYTLSNSASRALLSSDGRRAAFTSASAVDARLHAPALALEPVDSKGVPLANPAPRPVNPGEPATFFVAVVNNGTAADRGDLVLPSGATANRTSYETRPGDRWLAAVTITPPANTLPDTYSLLVHAVSAIVATEARNLTLQYVVGAKAGVALQYTGKASFVVRSGAAMDLDLGVINLGNEGGLWRMRTTQSPSSGGSWNVTVTPSGDSYVNRQSSAPVRVAIKVPTTARDGTINTIRLVAQMGNVSSLPIDLTFVVNPVIAANFTSDALGRLVTAGNSGWFNATLKNTGSVEATYYVTWTMASSPRTVVWNADVRGLGDDNRITLGPGQARPIVIKLLATQNAPPGAVGTLFLTATDYKVEHGRVTITEWLNLSATVVPRDIVPQTGSGLVVPGPAGVAAVAAVAAMALLRRRSA